MENTRPTICSKTISLDGQITQNVDYGVGYTIVWQKQPVDINVMQRSGVSPQQVILLVVQQLDFLNKTKHADEKYTQASKKLVQALKILQK